MKTLIVSLSFLLSSLLIIACVNPPNYPDTPVIEYIGVNDTEILQGAPFFDPDTLSIMFSFTDGDGDLSTEDATDIFVYDTRFPGADPVQYRIPTIPEDGTGNGIRGEITLNIVNSNNICCIENGFACPPNATIPVDTFSYEIEIRDRAGNFSNRIRTETLDILCQQ